MNHDNGASSPTATMTTKPHNTLTYEDIVRPTQDVDKHTPIEKLLTIAESSLATATSLRDYGRSDRALKDYLKAYEIAVEIIPGHQDYVSMKMDRKLVHKRHTALLQKLRAKERVFRPLKEEIKAELEYTPLAGHVEISQNGVQDCRNAINSPAPANGSTHIPSLMPSSPPSRLRNAAATHTESPSPARKKPMVQPKPAGLHGNTLGNGSNGSPAKPTGPPQDLMARFASLRGPSAASIQDPRIRTQPIRIGTLHGPRDMPHTSVKPVLPKLDVLPQLPRVPDAIYSPARGSMSSEAAELPSSTPRGMYSRSVSSAAHAGTAVAGLVKSPSSEDHLPPTVNSTTPPRMSKQARRSLPTKDTVTVDELVKLQQIGSKEMSILLVDIRSRDDFDNGHIMSSAIICVEPEILQRADLSAEEIVEAMVIAPSNEQKLLESRRKFDLIVFYDQSSAYIDSTKRKETTTRALENFRTALEQYDFGEDNLDSPKLRLLEGGLDAWMSVMGPALQHSATLKTAGVQPRRPLRNRAPSILSKPKPRRPSRAIQSPEEAKIWEEHINESEVPEPVKPADEAENVEFVRTTAEFMRRYPAITAQESMISPISERKAFIATPPRPNRATDMFSSLPAPPTRPAPAVPRPSYTGLRDADEHEHTMLTKITSRGGLSTRPRAGGLTNPGNWCYANSSLQSLFGSAGFADELINGDWQELYKAPQKADENIAPPQLLTKIIGALFQWMSHNKSVEAKTLMSYSYHINSKAPNGAKKDEKEIFGGRHQQDAQEYMSFLITELHDETNTKRDNLSEVQQPELRGKSILWGAKQYWEEHSKRNASLIDKYWRGLDVSVVVCSKCKHTTTKYQVFDLLILNTPQGKSTTTLEHMLADAFNVQHLEDYRCDGCGVKGHVRKETHLARLPDLLCVVCSRFADAGQKITTKIDFPIKNLDLTPYFIPSAHNPGEHSGSASASSGGGGGGGAINRHFAGPFTYDAYAVIQHRGGLDSGHYISVIKDDIPGSAGDGPTSSWRVANDSSVQSLEVGSDRNHPGVKMLSSHGGFLSFLTFYARNKSRE